MIFSKVVKIDGVRVSEAYLLRMGQQLVDILDVHGFITAAQINKKGQLKIGGQGHGFRVDTKQRGYNTQYSPFQKPKRTSYGSWECHVEYNNLINDFLDKMHVEATVKNSMYVIRDKSGRKTEQDWLDQTPQWVINNELRGFYKKQGFYEG